MPDNEPINAPYQRKEESHVRIRKETALLGGGALLLGLGIAAGVMFTRNDADKPIDYLPPGAGVTAVEPGTGLTPSTALSAREEKTEAQQRRIARAADSRTTSTSAGSRTYEERTEARAICKHCGVIESVTPVPVQGQSTGVGAVAGGVLGGVVGNQVGKGSGNTAATVLGAIGGGIAGNQIEKSRRTNNVYRVKVRMDDGTTKTFTRETELSPGTKVEVHDGAMRVVNSDG